MKKVVLLAMVISLMVVTPLYAQVMKQVDMETLKQMKAKLERLHAIETAKPDFKLTGIEVVQDTDGKIYVKDTAKAEVKVIDDLKFAGDVKVNADIKVYPVMKKDKNPFVSRFGLLYGVTADIRDKNKMDMGQLHLTFKSFEFKRLTLETPIINTKNWGMGIGWRLFSNTKVVFGGVVKWGEKADKDHITPYIGVGVNF